MVFFCVGDVKNEGRIGSILSASLEGSQLRNFYNKKKATTHWVSLRLTLHAQASAIDTLVAHAPCMFRKTEIHPLCRQVS